MSKPLRIAIVGAGVIGAVHARLIASLGERAIVGAVVDVDAERAQKLAASYGVPAFKTIAEAHTAQQLDIASVCTPSAYHADAVVKSLEVGLHVVVEKPIDVTLAAADRIIAAERSSGRTVSVISQRRFQPVASYLRAAIERGDLGRLTSATVESAFFRSQAYYESGDWRGTIAIDGGGALMNQGIHALDLLIWMLGKPVSIFAQTRCLAHEDIEVEDVAGALISFQGGAVGLLLASTAAYPGQPVRLAIYGTGGTAIMENDRLAYFSSASSPAPAETEFDERNIPSGWSEVDMAHQRQYLDVLDAIAARRPPAITTADGRRALQTVLAIYESARIGQSVTLAD